MPREPLRSVDSSVQHILDLMSRFGCVRARAMFGGHGLYRDGVMFALLADGGLYLKVDALSLADFEARSLKAFSFIAKERTVRLSYREAPPEALEDEVEMADWCQRAWLAALRAKAKGAANQGANRGQEALKLAACGLLEGEQGDALWVASAQGHLKGLPNLGPRSVELLEAAGITSLQQLQALGAVRAFVRARARTTGVSLNLLWALEGALTGRRWQDVAGEDRASLLMALEDVERAGSPGGSIKP